jgi:hypothetical protein
MLGKVIEIAGGIRTAGLLANVSETTLRGSPLCGLDIYAAWVIPVSSFLVNRAFDYNYISENLSKELQRN